LVSEPVPLLHVGYLKTGTTWLQRHLFRSSGLPFRRADRRSVNEIFVRPNPLDFSAGAAREALGPFLRQAAVDGAVPVLSQERLSGGLSIGGWDAREIGCRLAATLPGARVLIVVREQMSMILSSYKQYARTGGVMSLRRMLRPTRRVRSTPQFNVKHFEYDRLIGHYRSLFGPERVLVLAFEQLRQDRDLFVARICRFCGVEAPAIEGGGARANASLSGPVLAVKRWFNLLFVTGPQNPGCLIPVGENRVLTGAFGLADRLVPGFVRRWSDRRMLRSVRAAAGDCFRESNARTAEMTGLDLAGYGYDMPKGSPSEGAPQS
jgi:hypothetical protein